MPLKIALVQVSDFDKLCDVICNFVGNAGDASPPERKRIIDVLKRLEPPIYAPYPMGILALAAYAREKFGKKIDINIIDMLQQRLEVDNLMERLERYSPDIVGLSSFSAYAPTVHDIARRIKSADKRCRVIIGGPYASASAPRAARDKNIDCVVCGEGELTFEEIIRRILAKRDLKGIPGTAEMAGRNTRINSPGNLIEDISLLPFPAVDLIDIKGYFGHALPLHYNAPWMIMFNSRGCPYKCAYCHNIFGRYTRFMSAKRTLGEMVFYHKKYGIKEFQIWDDIFNLDIRRATEICTLIAGLKTGFRLYFSGGLRADIMRKELLDKMIEAGTSYICYAVESGSPRIQKLINKNLNLKKAAEAINFTSDAGVWVNVYNMLGFPTETLKEMRMTIDYNVSLRHHSITLFKVIPQEGTPLYEMARGKFKTAGGRTDMYTEYHKTAVGRVPKERFKKLVEEGFKKFYLDPDRIKRIINMKSPVLTKDEMLRTYSGALRMLKPGSMSNVPEKLKRSLKEITSH